MKKSLLTTTGLLLAALLFLGFNILTGAALKSVRIDLTENRLYTLSPGTRNLLATLEEPITLRLYFSKKLAADAGSLTSYAQRVQELLEQYVARSRGKVSLEVIDPQPYTEEEDRAVGYGLKGVPISSGGEMLYFGLAGTNSTDQEEVIPFLQESKEESLEYDITKVVYTLSNPKKTVVGLLTTLPMEGNPMARFMNPGAESNPWFLVEGMRQLFEVKSVAATTEKIDSDVDVLMIVHPQMLSQRTLYAIDQYVLGGGKVLAFVDPHCESQEVRQDPSNPMSAMMANRTSDLGPLLAAWGLELSPEDIAGDRECALRIAPQGVPVDYLPYIGLRDDKGCFAKDDFVTGTLEIVNLGTAGVLTRKEGATTAVTPLIETTPRSMRINRSGVMFGPDPNKLLESFVSGDERLMVAARVSGPARTAFPDGKPQAEQPEPEEETGEEKADEQPEEPLKESKEIHAIVVADCDMLTDAFWTRTQNFFGQRIPIPMANNADFAINALDNLSGSNDLISLRSRGRFHRPFERVAEIRRTADTHFGQKVRELEDKLKDAESRIQELQGQKEVQSSLILSPEQQKEVERFRDERAQTRKELRAIKHDRDKDIEALGSVLKFANILLIPLLLVAAATVLARARATRTGLAATSVGSRS